jgi:5'-deoxynucleotidase YfbR-like HD superfamily hydrolase
MQTYPGGRQFWPCDPRPEDVDILDIAHALSNQCRYGGHVREFYSVGQHCVLVSLAVPPEDALLGLLHDAAEAYVVDLPRPLKRSGFLDGYFRIEAGVHRAIAQRFGIPEDLPKSVHVADNRLLLTEKRDLVARTDFVWTEAQAKDGSAEPYTERIRPWPPLIAYHRFLKRFGELTTPEQRRGALGA